MSGYGSTTTSEGKELTSDGRAPQLTGERVVGNELVSFDFAKDKETGDSITSRAELKFKQSNGAIVNIVFFDSTEGWAIDRTNAQLLHVFSKIVTKEEYYAAIGKPANFQEFVERIKNNIVPKAAGKTYTCKFVYIISRASGRANVGFPNFPNFFELDGTTPSTLSTNPKYDVYIKPWSPEVPANTAATNDDVPF